MGTRKTLTDHSVFGSATKPRVGHSGFRILTGLRDFFLLHNVQTVSGAHRASYSMCTGFFLGVKWPGRGVDYSLQWPSPDYRSTALPITQQPTKSAQFIFLDFCIVVLFREEYKFLEEILGVGSVKTQLILLSIINVSTCFDSKHHHRANSWTIFKVHQVKVGNFGIPKCFQL